MSKYGSNLVKAYCVSNTQEPRIIDADAIIEAKMMNEGSDPGLYDYGEAEYEDVDDDYIPGPQDFVGGIGAETLENINGSYDEASPENNIIHQDMSLPEPEYTESSPEDLIAAAQAQIEELHQQANREIEQSKADAYEEGRNMGYEEGMAMARAESEEQLRQLQEKEKQLEQEYKKKIEELEPQFVHVLTGIYERVFNVELSEYRELIIRMLQNTMEKTELQDNYIVHISPEDYPYVFEHKDELLPKSVPEGTTINVVEDATLRKNDAMIETAGGIYDCGLGTELKLLRNRLELLSYSGPVL